MDVFSLNTGAIAITGGIGCGKSAVLAAFASFGAETFDADAVVNDLYTNAPDFTAVLGRRWGSRVFGDCGNIDKKKVGEIIFAAESERKWLESIIHPLVEKRLQQFIVTARYPAYAEIPLLFECGWERHFTRVVVVWARAQLVLDRLLAKGFSENAAKRRMNSQLKPLMKLENADFVIVNNGSLALLSEQCAIIHGYGTDAGD